MAERTVPAARQLSNRFCPNTGLPTRVGMLWPPRLMVHNVATKEDSENVKVRVDAYIRHMVRQTLEVTVRASDEPAVDSEGRLVGGIQVVGSKARVSSAWGGHSPVPGTPEKKFRKLPIEVSWSQRFVTDIRQCAWVRQTLFVEITDGRTRRIFQWYLYLTPAAASLPAVSAYDDHPHYRWIDEEGVLSKEGVERSWVELPSPMSAPGLSPASWVQPNQGEPPTRGGGTPEQTSIVSVYPVEPPIPSGVETVGWNGALGGHDPRPSMQALAVQSKMEAGSWTAWLAYLDSNSRGSSPVPSQIPTRLEEPTPCVWPRIISASDEPLNLYDLVGRNDDHCEIKVNFRVALPPDSEAFVVERGSLRLGAEEVGSWQEGPLLMAAGQTRNLRCKLDLASLRDAVDGRLKLTLQFEGRPSRGVVWGEHLFRTENGPYARLTRTRTQSGGKVRTPWLVMDLGTEGTCASVAFLDGYVPRVIQVDFDDGPIYPSRVFLSPGLGGVYTLTDTPSDDAIYTTMIKLGLRFGDGAHPGCPDHIAATEVARYFLKRFLLEVRERMAWFPLEDASVLVSFPPRLAAMPRFVRSLHETFAAVLKEVVWKEGKEQKLLFREEGFLVSVPSLYKDLQLHAGAAKSTYYWVMDFGGGTTDVAGFLVQPDPDGDEHTIERLTYPQRLAHHLSGNDVTRAFYLSLRRHFDHMGLVAGDDATADGNDGARQFPFPVDPYPSAKSSAISLINQSALRELAEAVKCCSTSEAQQITVRDMARSRRSSRIKTVDGHSTTLLALLVREASDLGSMAVGELHAEVLDPTKSVDTTQYLFPKCTKCEAEARLPGWLFSTSRSFRYRCKACNARQQVDWIGGAAQSSGELHEEAPISTDIQEMPASFFPSDLQLRQGGRTYKVPDLETLRRWVRERRVGRSDEVSGDADRWMALGSVPELAEVFAEPESIGVDITQEVPHDPYREAVYPEGRPQTDTTTRRPRLGHDIRLFLAACREALERAVAGLPDPANTEVVVLVAGRASQFEPVAEGVRTFMPGRVVHMNPEWVRRSFGSAGQIDPGANLKTLTVNGGGLFALLMSNPDTSQLMLSFDTLAMDCPVYLRSVNNSRPWLLTSKLDLRPGRSMPLVSDRDELFGGEKYSPFSDAPVPRPLPPRTPLTGELRLVIDGLPEDCGWEPYVTIARAMAMRHHGRRSRTRAETVLQTADDQFVLGPLTQDQQISFVRMLPRLPLLGGGMKEG